MKIIYAGVQKENYNPERGFSFEYNNFYFSLRKLPSIQVIEHPYDLILQIGKKKFNERLLELVKREKPDLFFAFMFTDELDKNILAEIKKITASAAWFSDDNWRFYNYSRYWASYFTWIITTFSWIPESYRKIGFSNIIRSQWACNNYVWKPVEIERNIDVSFVGQRTPSRDKVVNMLRENGIQVFVKGWGWPEGRATQEEMIKIFSRSKINLNINSVPPLFSPKRIGRLFLKRSVNKFVFDFHLLDNLKGVLAMSIPHGKARPFELAGCRAFVISGYGDDMENYYQENKEMIFYRSGKDLVEKIKYYLARPEEREQIAAAAYKRTMEEHTYEKRFLELFRKMNLK